MKSLNGAEIADYIKERQAKAVRNLLQEHHIQARLAIVRTNPDPAGDGYVQLQQACGSDLLVEVVVHTVPQSKALQTIQNLNADPQTHGIIVQLPLTEPTQTTELLNAVTPAKDVDGVSGSAVLDPATPVAIDWLLAAYNIDLRDKRLVIVGNARSVGQLLAKRWQTCGYDVVVADADTADLAAVTSTAEVLICATGIPRLVHADTVNPDAVIVDADISNDQNGFGSLVACALFDNVIQAARSTIIN